jgi:hypothetical protein
MQKTIISISSIVAGIELKLFLSDLMNESRRNARKTVDRITITFFTEELFIEVYKKKASEEYSIIVKTHIK